MRFLVLFSVLIASIACSQAQTRLSDKAEIRVLTMGPYQGELYSAFGHSAIRVMDPVNGFDLLFNYGVFDFNQPNFYLNFARGFLHYQLALTDYAYFRDNYIADNRFIHEQVLNLSQAQKQSYFDFLVWNIQEENRYYYYDYFYDNCATRVRDGIRTALGEAVEFDGSYIQKDRTIRDLTDMYLQQQPWGDLGIDICLGLPMDTIASPDMYMFLPDYIEKGFDHAFISTDSGRIPLVKETVVTYSSTPEPDRGSLITPLIAFSALLLIGIGLTLHEYRVKKRYRWFDFIFFTVLGLIGWLFVFLWFGTDHKAARNNLNILWAIPIYFPISFLLLRRNLKSWVNMLFLLTGIGMILLLIIWSFLPQNLHNSLIPIVLLAGLRSWQIFRLK